jgi:hypothetical protein
VCGDNIKCGAEKKLLRHEKTKKHIKNAASMRQQPSMFQNSSAAQAHINKLKQLEIQLCLFIIEHDVSIQVADHLTEFIKSLHSTFSNITCDRTKCTAIMKNVIGEYCVQELVSEMKEKQFAILLDESTDITEAKNLAVVVRCVREKLDTFKVNDEFLCLLPLTDGTSKSIYEAVTKFFSDYSVPYKKNMIAIASDGANVMAGSKTSVAALFKRDIPKLYILKCYIVIHWPYVQNTLLRKEYHQKLKVSLLRFSIISSTAASVKSS